MLHKFISDLFLSSIHPKTFKFIYLEIFAKLSIDY